MTATSLRPAKKDWVFGVWAGFMLGFGVNIGISGLSVAVGVRTLDPIESGLFALAFIALSALSATTFLHSIRRVPS